MKPLCVNTLRRKPQRKSSWIQNPSGQKGNRGIDEQVNWDTATASDMSFPLEEERYQLTTVQRRGNVVQGENNEEAYDGKGQFKAWRRAVLLRLGEKGLEGALKPVDIIAWSMRTM
eukprot:g8831.t1